MDNILAIDASTKRTGLAWFEGQELHYGVLESSVTPVERRIGVMRDKLIEFLQNHPAIDTIVLEEVRHDGMNDHTGKVLMWLQGCLAVAIYEFNKNIKIEFSGASTWRSILHIQKYAVKRNPQKQMDIKYINEKYGLNLNPTQDDEADAIGILTAYHINKNALINNPTIAPSSGNINTYKSAF